MAALGLDDGFIGPIVRERVAELIAQDIAEAVRAYRPDAVLVDSEHAKPYAAFLWGAAREVWEELQRS